MKKREIAAVIAALLGLVAAYPQLKSSVQEIVNDLIWLLSQLP